MGESVIVHMTREQARAIIDACEKQAEEVRDLISSTYSSAEQEPGLTRQAEALEDAASLVNNELIAAGGAE